MKTMLASKILMRATEIITAGELISKVIDEITTRTGDIADMLEKIDKSIPEVNHD